MRNIYIESEFLKNSEGIFGQRSLTYSGAFYTAKIAGDFNLKTIYRDSEGEYFYLFEAEGLNKEDIEQVLIPRGEIGEKSCWKLLKKITYIPCCDKSLDLLAEYIDNITRQFPANSIIQLNEPLNFELKIISGADTKYPIKYKFKGKEFKLHKNLISFLNKPLKENEDDDDEYWEDYMETRY